MVYCRPQCFANGIRGLYVLRVHLDVFGAVRNTQGGLHLPHNAHFFVISSKRIVFGDLCRTSLITSSPRSSAWSCSSMAAPTGINVFLMFLASPHPTPVRPKSLPDRPDERVRFCRVPPQMQHTFTFFFPGCIRRMCFASGLWYFLGQSRN